MKTITLMLCALYITLSLQECPVTHAIISNTGVCISCETVIPGCSNCSQNGQCYQCFSQKIYFDGQCLNQCPQGYQQVDLSCEIEGYYKVNNETTTTSSQQTVDALLLSSSVFPLPFTVVGCILFIACCLPKLQNTNSYLIGAAYSFWGLIETGVISYLLIRYYLLGNTIYQQLMVILLLIVVCVIYFLNILSLIIQSLLLLCFDDKFNYYLALYSCNKTFYGVVTIISFLVNYKFRMILFTRLFSYQCLKAMLDSVNKFRMFNIFSFVGILYQILCLYVCFSQIFEFTRGTQIFMWFLDAIIVVIINIILAIVVVCKRQDFFATDDEDGLILNKKFNADGEQFSKQALDKVSYQDVFINKDYDSYGPLQKDAALVSSQNYTSTISIKEIQVQQTIKFDQQTPKQQQKSKIKAYFAHHEYSDNKFNKTKVQNIFETDEKSQEEQEKNRSQQFQENLISEQGSSNHIISPNKPSKTNKQVVVNKIKKNSVTVSEDISKRINQRQVQLDQLRQQQQQKQRLRWQLRKQRKLMKKSIQPPSQPEERYFQQSVKQQTVKQQTVKQQSIKQQSVKQPSFQQITIKEQSIKQTQQVTDENQKQFRLNRILDQQNPQINVDQVSPPRQSKKGWLQMKVDQDISDLPAFSGLNGNRQNQIVKQATEEQSQTSQLHKMLRKKKKNNKHKLQQIKSKTLQPKYDNQHQNNIKKQELKNNESPQKLDQRKVQQVVPRRKTTSENQQSLNLSLENSRENSSRHGYYQYKDQRNRRFNQTPIMGQPQQNNNQNPINQNQDNEQQPYVYDQVNTDFEDRSNTRQNMYNLDIQNKDKYISQSQSSQQQNLENNNGQKSQSGLEDSFNEDDAINIRPVQAIKKKGMNNNQALLKILQKTERQKQKINMKKKLYFKGQQQKKQSDKNILRPNQQHIQLNEKSSQKSRVYLAGVRQFQQKPLTHKHSLNHPIIPNKMYIKDGLSSEQGQSSLIQSQRNMSLNNAVFSNKKYNSKDVIKDSDSSNIGNIDDMDFQNVSIKPTYAQLLNNRQQQIIPRKPGTSSSHRVKYLNHQDSKLSKLGVQRMKLANRTVTGQDDTLRQYYNQDNRQVIQRQSIERKKSRQKITKSRSKNKHKRSPQKQHSVSKKRMKHLQKIYAPKK